MASKGGGDLISVVNHLPNYPSLIKNPPSLRITNPLIPTVGLKPLDRTLTRVTLPATGPPRNPSPGTSPVSPCSPLVIQALLYPSTGRPAPSINWVPRPLPIPLLRHLGLYNCLDFLHSLIFPDAPSFDLCKHLGGLLSEQSVRCCVGPNRSP